VKYVYDAESVVALVIGVVVVAVLVKTFLLPGKAEKRSEEEGQLASPPRWSAVLVAALVAGPALA
jgi:hypothetical protein